ncbi:MAG: hypothetical protein ACJAZ9_001719 [Neolewinella sp.]|jgi:hypothetical protein
MLGKKLVDWGALGGARTQVQRRFWSKDWKAVDFAKGG